MSMPVRFERSIHVPEDEICFFIFDAPSGRDAALVAQRAELDPIRIVEAISSRRGGAMGEEGSHPTHEQRRETT